MPVESATYITDLVPTNPLVSDPIGQGYQHLDLIKSVLKLTFPNLNGAVTGTPAELNAAAQAFSGSALVVPQNGTAGAEIVLTPAAGNSTASISSSGNGIKISSTNTASPAVTTDEVTSDGAGNLTATTSLTAPTINATKTIQQAGAPLVPSGIIVMWSGAATAVPAGWYLCDGTNGTPDLRDKFIVGAGDTYAVGAAGGAATVTLTAANLAPHSHSINDVQHNHTLSQSPHGHADAGHNHSDAGHGHSDAGHEHNYTAASSYDSNGVASNAATSANPPGQNHTETGYANIQTGYANIQTGYANIQGANANISIAAAYSGITGTNSTGSGAAFGILPPYFALCFIMKA